MPKERADMVKGKKPTRYNRVIGFFPHSRGVLDRTLSACAWDTILMVLNDLDDLRLSSIAQHLGIERNRLTRILDALGVREQFDEERAKRRA